MRLLLQFPEGLKKEALKYAEKYEQEGHQVFLSGSSCYGACDLALEEARAVNADKIIHFGHARFVRAKIPIEVEYVEWRIDVDLDNFEKAAKQLDFRSVALATTVQHIHQLGEMKKILERTGREVHTSKGTLAAYEGQVLGCDAGAVHNAAGKADAIVFVGDGNFHALAIDIDKPVFVIQPKSGQIRQINDDIIKLRKRRKGAVLAAVDAKTFGILVSTKIGQSNLPLAEKIEKELVALGKRAEILVSNEISASALNNFMSFECYVVTACPRLADDRETFGRPVLNPGMYAEFMRIMKGMKAR
jgi:2-(3-amino-3-carboxypropyl)histidine synthase